MVDPVDDTYRRQMNRQLTVQEPCHKLARFEGRNYVGWHRHVTLTSLAQAFCTLLRIDPKAPAPA